jgi:tetratricopeptide (TPR) repeat protein
MPLAPPAGPVLIVTSRQNFTLPGLFAKDLHTLPPDRACKLLLKIEPRIGDAAARLAALCGYLPLALRTAASALQNRKDLSLPEFLRKMQDARGRVDETGVALAFRTSSELLEPPLRALWFQLSVFPGTFEPAGAAAVWQIDPDAAKEGLSRLAAYNLVEWIPATSRYRLHDLARDFTTLQLDEPARIAAQGRHAEHYVNVLAAADQKYMSGGAFLSEGLTLFDLEWSNIQAGQAWAAAHREGERSAPQFAEAYPDANANVSFRRQPPRQRIKWLEAALDSARRLGDRRHEGAVLGNLGIAYSFLGEYRRAVQYYEQQLAIAREVRDRRGEGNALGNLGVAYYWLGERRHAIEFHEQQLAITREIGDRRAEGNALANLGKAYSFLGEYRRAIEFHEQHLAIAREIGDRQGEGNALGNLGNAYHALGEHHRGFECSNQLLAIARELGDRLGEGAALFNAGLVLNELGDRTEAIRNAEQALGILVSIGSPEAEKVRQGLAALRKPG